MSTTTPRLGAELLISGSHFGHITWNEFLARMDAFLHPAASGVTNTPDPNPGNGTTWIVGTAPTGEWVGHANDVAVWYGWRRPVSDFTGGSYGRWLYLGIATTPDDFKFYRVYRTDTSAFVKWNGSAWEAW